MPVHREAAATSAAPPRGRFSIARGSTLLGAMGTVIALTWTVAAPTQEAADPAASLAGTWVPEEESCDDSNRWLIAFPGGRFLFLSGSRVNFGPWAAEDEGFSITVANRVMWDADDRVWRDVLDELPPDRRTAAVQLSGDGRFTISSEGEGQGTFVRCGASGGLAP